MVYLTVGGKRDCELIGEIDGNVLVNTADTTVKNLHTNGNLYIAAGVDVGDVTLNNITVGGTTYIIGGTFEVIVLDSSVNTRVEISGVTEIDHVFINNTGTVTHNGMTVTYDAATEKLTFGGTLDKVVLNADGTATVTIGGVIYDVIPPDSVVAKFALAPGSVVKEMITNGAVDITGTGKIDKLTVHEDGVVVDKSVNFKNDDIFVDDNVRITVDGKDYIGEDKQLPPGNSGNSNTTPANEAPNIAVKTYTYDKDDAGNLVITFKLGSGNLKATGISAVNGATSADYTVSGITLTITEAYMMALSSGEKILTVQFNGSTSTTVNITIIVKETLSSNLPTAAQIQALKFKISDAIEVIDGSLIVPGTTLLTDIPAGQEYATLAQADLLSTAITAAKAALSAATSGEVTTATDTLTAAISKFNTDVAGNAPGTGTGVNTSALLQKIGDAKALLAYTEALPSTVTILPVADKLLKDALYALEGSCDACSVAIGAAETALATPSVDSDAVDAAVSALRTAMEAFEAACVEGTAVVVDNSSVSFAPAYFGKEIEYAMTIEPTAHTTPDDIEWVFVTSTDGTEDGVGGYGKTGLVHGKVGTLKLEVTISYLSDYLPDKVFTLPVTVNEVTIKLPNKAFMRVAQDAETLIVGGLANDSNIIGW